MQKLMGLVRRCTEDYKMIVPGDRIAVGVSGGKDSVALLVLLAAMREYYPAPYELTAISIDLGFGMDFSPVAELCSRIGVPYKIAKTEIANIVFNTRQEKNPCSMCAKMRRGVLNQALLEQGFSKVALGHHYDDAVETFFMNLIFEGRLSCFQPVTFLDRTGVTQIRPLLYIKERLWQISWSGSICLWSTTGALRTSGPSGRRSRICWSPWKPGIPVSGRGPSAPCSGFPCLTGSCRKDKIKYF